MIPKFLQAWFRVPELIDADWESLRLALLRRSLALLLPLIAVYALFTALLGHPVLPALAGLGFGSVVLLLAHQRPDARRPITWGLGVAALALMGLSILQWTGPAPAPGLVIAVLLGTMGLMLDGAWLGGTLFAGGMALVAVALHRVPAGDAVAATAVGLQGGLGLGLFVSAAGWYRGLSRGQAQVLEARRRLSQQRDERQVLSLTLFHELREAQAGLQRALGPAGEPPWNAVLEQARRMEARAVEVRGLRARFAEAPAESLEPVDFGREVMLAILWVSALLALGGFGVYLATGDGAAWHGPFALAVLLAGIVIVRQGRRVPLWLAWVVVGLGPLIMGLELYAQRGRGLPPTFSFWCLSILNAGLLLNGRVALGLAALGAALSAAALLALPPGQAGAWQFGLVLWLGFAMLLLICLQAVVWKRQLLRLLEQGGHALAQSLAQRRRLLGTLFHDLANPLTALLGLCEQARAGLAGPGDPARARRLARRLHELLEGSQAWILGEGGDDAGQLQAVDLEPVLAGMADLYQESLAAKRLGLSLDSEAGLRARAQAAVLRDSVLSNLVSNAIKFSRPGSSLELEASATEGGICIELRDRGPGLDPGLRAALEAGQDLPSRPGTQGEAGSGLGLALAREHVQRMGGRLELLDREGGGTLTRVWLQRA